MKIQIDKNSRVSITGKTGSGKTFLAKKLLSSAERLIVFDTKNNLKDSFNLSQETTKNWKRFEKGENIRLQIKTPIINGNEIVDYYDNIFKRVYNTGNCIVYIDEAYGVTNGANDVSTFLRALFTRGREFGIGVFTSTQRPKNIPNIMFTESEHFFVFRTQLEDDRKKLAGFIGDKIKIPITEEHGFYYYSLQMNEPVYIKKI